MPRGRSLAITLLMLAVIAAAGVAFVFAQEQKQAKPAVRLLAVPEILSPGCRCEYDEAKITMRAQAAATIRVEVLNAAGQVVEVLADGKSVPRGNLAFGWHGTGSADGAVPPGDYRVRIVLLGQDRVYTPDKVMKVVPPRRARQLLEQAEPAQEPQREDPPDSR